MQVYLLHPALVHFPIAFLIGASASGLAYIHWRRLPTLRVLTWWGVVAGWITLLVAILTGLIAQGGLPPDAPYRTVLNLHTTSGLVLAVLYGDLLYRGWLHRSGKGTGRPRRGKVTPVANEEAADEETADEEELVEYLLLPNRKWQLSLQLAFGIVLVIATGFWGGELVYTWGVNVTGE